MTKPNDRYELMNSDSNNTKKVLEQRSHRFEFGRITAQRGHRIVIGGKIPFPHKNNGQTPVVSHSSSRTPVIAGRQRYDAINIVATIATERQCRYFRDIGRAHELADRMDYLPIDRIPSFVRIVE